MSDQPRRLSTGPPEDLQDLAAYRAKVSHAVVSLDVHAGDPDSFRGRLRAGVTGDIHLFDMHADAHAVHRTPVLIARAPQRYFKFSLIEQGTGMIVQDGRETELRPGDMALYDTDKPYSFLFDDWTRMSIVMFPRELLGIPADLLAGLTAVRLDSTSGAGATIRPYLSALSHQIGQVEGHVAQRLFRTAFELVGTLLEDNLASASPAGNHGALLRRILNYIDENLAQPDLCPTQIAAAHFISVRHLHALFSDQSTTVSTVIRTRRLERCYDELVNPLLNGRPVTAVGRAHGFADATHFSRAFRAHFGVPPSAVRRENA
ncbi:helix-turn-helix domain-containing protein [Streptomyces bathyalis]|uniref:Helix-turn-helix domain-containing protein n=1 Tax=Streptomyces bathyalis TaxID=2710756 RepID=A0A7T1T3V6_9ACTN|nr:helix-turn-helix domain-containing protein [Streptomyces bathyalis]QPP05931.1 helix-turn-helix domain-containing protein [Streptomyces bathyalis]